MKEYMISIIRQHQYFEAGALEQLTEMQIRELYEALIDWIG